MKKLFKTLLAVLIAMMIIAPLAAESAKVTYVKGKVEVSRNGEWVPLKVGDMVDVSETINTGFQSQANVNVNGAVITIDALTRVKLSTITTTTEKKSGAAVPKTTIVVDTGRVNAQVRHDNTQKVDFTARTAVATASVRGTEFEIRADGTVKCYDGSVAVYSSKKYNAKRSSGKRAKKTAEEEGEATATTAPDEISDYAPRDAVVVAEGQTTTFRVNGEPSKPGDTARTTAEHTKYYVTSAGEKDAADIEGKVSNGGGGTFSIEIDVLF